MSWSSPTVIAALKRGESSLRDVERVTVFINQLPDAAERRLSWKYFYACRFAACPFTFTSEGLRPLIR